MSQPPLRNPDARYWDDLVEEFDFSPEEKRQIREGADRMIVEVQASRLADGKALGGKLKIIADSGDEAHILG